MTAFTGGRLGLMLLFLVLIALPAAAGERLVSSIRNTNAVMEANGFRLLPAFEEGGRLGAEDLAPPQAVEIIRPDDRPLTLGRLFTSSRDIRLEAAKRNFGPGEPAMLILRNIAPTPPEGQIYTVYVQLASPIRATLKFDAFVQSQVIKVPELAGPVTEDAPGEETPESDEDAQSTAAAATAGQPAAASETGAGKEEADAAEMAAATPAATATQEQEQEKAADSPAEADPASGEVAATTSADKTPQEPELKKAADSPAAADPASGGMAAAAEEVKREPALPFVSLITIGVPDMQRSGKFYESLGWKRVSRNPSDPAVFFQLNGQALVLYPLPDLLREQNMGGVKPVPGGITLALHVAGKEEVTDLYRKFLAAGASPLREPTEMPSGAVTCYVADLDGNPWEISWVPRFRIDAGGGLWLP